MPNYKMKNIGGRVLTLNEIKKENGLLVIFSCNTCPFVIAWENRYPGLGALCNKNKIGMVLVNSNEAKRTGADSMAKMEAHASEKKYNCAYVLDKNSKLANTFGAKTTPHVFLFDKSLSLVYQGAIDDNFKNAVAVTQSYLNNAIDNMIQGKSIQPDKTTAKGCSIKRVKG